MKSCILVVVCAACMMVFGSIASADEKEEFHNTYPLSSRGTVSLENINGDATITAWDRNEVKVDAVKEGEDREELKEVTIEVDADSDRVSIRTEYPHEFNHHHHHGVRVTYNVTVPANANLDNVRLVNGDLKVQDVKGNVDLNGVNGAIDVHGISSDAHLETVNGKVDAHLNKGKKDVSVKTVNGSVQVYVPADAGARVEADTLNGMISNDFGMEVEKKGFIGRRLKGKIGNGSETDIEINTLNGAVDIRRQ